MDVLVLSSLARAGAEGLALASTIQDRLRARAWGVEVADLSSITLKPCVGCGACAERHPGRCAIKDAYSEIFARLPRADLLVLAGCVRFGCWDPLLKTALDRSMPLMVGLYTWRGGELHHRPRYERPSRLLGIGLTRRSPEGEGEALRFLVTRHAVNLAIPRHAALAGPDTSLILGDLDAALAGLEAA